MPLGHSHLQFCRPANSLQGTQKDGGSSLGPHVFWLYNAKAFREQLHALDRMVDFLHLLVPLPFSKSSSLQLTSACFGETVLCFDTSSLLVIFFRAAPLLDPSDSANREKSAPDLQVRYRDASRPEHGLVTFSASASLEDRPAGQAPCSVICTPPLILNEFCPAPMPFLGGFNIGGNILRIQIIDEHELRFIALHEYE